MPDATCINCHDALGADAGELPIFAADDDGRGGSTKTEAWCPQCFVYVRAPLSANRWRKDAIAAVQCSRCGCKSFSALSVQGAQCGRCRAPVRMILGPKPCAVTYAAALLLADASIAAAVDVDEVKAAIKKRRA